MPRKEGQKLKLLTLLEIFVRETDEKHPISVPRMVELLKERGIVAERKSVYDDIQTLNEMPDTPFEIVQQRGRGGGYYMVDTPFELAELKLLVDAVYASKFITARKSKVLIEKLGRFTSRYRQEELDRKVLVSGRVKSQEEKILYSVDTLHSAITAGNQVRFKYCDWDLQKQMVPRHEGQLYTVSPWVMVWENGNYYMIAYTEGRLKHYRVDKMRKVELLPDTEREGAEEYAEFDGFEVTEAEDGMEAVEICRKEDFDLIVMDIMMPRLDGYSAIKEIRKTKQIPVIMLSARGEEYDKLFGFEIGIDDYVVKPFSPKELLARIKAVLKRAAAKEQPMDIIRYEGLEINVTGREVSVDGKPVSLTPKEYDLLFYLVRNKGIALSREKLLEEVWGYDFFGDDRTVDTHIKMLRNSLGEYRKFIKTLRGMGYKFETT